MIPIQLTIEGLYSYKEKQVIDFTELTSAGLFGIVGGVGSGKSAILEAISYALYGQTERMHGRDNRNYNMMNLRSNRSLIELDFENHAGAIYRCKRTLRRNSKRYDDVSTDNTTFYQRVNDQWLPLEHTNAEEIVGLSYQNFKRTIIIPQGQFKEFLELGAADRTRMMKEIFQLHRFDLYNKVDQLAKTNKTILDQLEGQLKGYAKVTKESLQESEELLDKKGKEYNKKQTLFKQHTETYEALKVLKADLDTLKRKQVTYNDLKKQQPEFEKRKKHVERYDNYYKLFNEEINKLKEGNKQLNENRKESAGLKETLDSLTKKLTDANNKLDSIKTYHSQLPQKRREENDLTLILQMLQAQVAINTQAKRQKEGNRLVAEKKLEFEEQRKLVNEKTRVIDQLQEQQLNTNVLLAVDRWFTTDEQLSNSIDEHQKTLKEQEKNLMSINEQLKSKETDSDIDRFNAHYSKSIQQLEQREQKLEQQRDHLTVQQSLAQYARELHDGKACPLCGSTEHPAVAHDDVSKELNELSASFKQLQKEREALQNHRLEAIRLIDRVTEERKLIQLIQKQIEELIQQQLKHHEQFQWQEFDRNNKAAFEKQKEASAKTQEQIVVETKKLREQQDKLEKTDETLEKYRKELDKIEQQIQNLQSTKAAHEKNLKIITFVQYADHSIEDIQQKYKQLKKENDRVEQEYTTLSEQINKLTSQKETSKALKKKTDETIDKLNENIEQIESSLETKLQKEQIVNISVVEQILQTPINVVKEREAIQSFELDFGIIQKEITTLQDRLKKAAYEEATYESTKEQWEELQKQVEELNGQVIALQTQFKQLQTQFEEKKELLKKQEQLQKRAENLRVLVNLFRGEGFVAYISTIYLNQLCDHANVRFQRMTRNQLQLQLNEKNEFEIVDYLNGGHTRSVKTLSGGQAFQASLSLALALAESVQTNAAADKNFFFIDEGFGTQDDESINIVFETLQSLNKENKIVGIISHVEELKERIPMTLSVIKDDEHGSRVQLNR